MNFSITKSGLALDKSLYNWDERTKTLSTNESGLVLDFSDISYVKFRTGSRCTFKTDCYCVFDTGSDCIFKTGSNCTFDTSFGCVFDTIYNCIFDTGENCVFDVGFECTFKTNSDCTFKTGSYCTFDTGDNCTFDTNWNCIFKTGKECVIIRKDIYEVIEIPENVGIKLNNSGISGYTIVESKKEIIEIAGQRYYRDEVEERLKELEPV